MSIVIEESKPYLKGLSTYIQREIEPWLRSREAHRQQAVTYRQRVTYAAAIVGIGIVGVLWLLLPFFPAMPLSILVLIVFFCVVGFAGRKADHLGGEVKQFVTTKLAAFFGFACETLPAGLDVDRFVDLGLVPSFDRRVWDDELSGKVHGVPFNLAEIELQRIKTSRDSKGRSKTVVSTVFDGLLLTLEYPVPFEGSTIIQGDEGLVFNWLKEKFGSQTTVAFDDPAFEAAFQVYATKGEEAKRLLDPLMRRRILALRDVMGAWRLQLAFDAGRILLAARTETDEHFEVGSMDTALLDSTRIQRMVSDFCIVLDVVECLDLRRATASGG